MQNNVKLGLGVAAGVVIIVMIVGGLVYVLGTHIDPPARRARSQGAKSAHLFEPKGAWPLWLDSPFAWGFVQTGSVKETQKNALQRAQDGKFPENSLRILKERSAFLTKAEAFGIDTEQVWALSAAVVCEAGQGLTVCQGTPIGIRLRLAAPVTPNIKIAEIEKAFVELNSSQSDAPGLYINGPIAMCLGIKNGIIALDLVLHSTIDGDFNTAMRFWEHGLSSQSPTQLDLARFLLHVELESLLALNAQLRLNPKLAGFMPFSEQAAKWLASTPFKAWSMEMHADQIVMRGHLKQKPTALLDALARPNILEFGHRPTVGQVSVHSLPWAQRGPWVDAGLSAPAGMTWDMFSEQMMSGALRAMVPMWLSAAPSAFFRTFDMADEDIEALMLHEGFRLNGWAEEDAELEARRGGVMVDGPASMAVVMTAVGCDAYVESPAECFQELPAGAKIAVRNEVDFAGGKMAGTPVLVMDRSEVEARLMMVSSDLVEPVRQWPMEPSGGQVLRISIDPALMVASMPVEYQWLPKLVAQFVKRVDLSMSVVEDEVRVVLHAESDWAMSTLLMLMAKR